MLRAHEHGLVLLWLICTGLVICGFVVCVDQGLLRAMVDTDRSGICVVVLALYLIGLGHSLRGTLSLSRELNAAYRIEQLYGAPSPQQPRLTAESLVTADTQPLPECVIGAYLRDLCTALAAPLGNDRDPSALLLDAYVLRLRRPQEFGWFLIDGMLKVGFLGTLIGFILMLGSISGSQNLDASMLQQILQKMSYGMSTALNTTLVSLVGAIFLSIPYYLLDRASDELLEATVRISEVHVLPQLQQPRTGS
jgi:hypothetical protein